MMTNQSQNDRCQGNVLQTEVGAPQKSYKKTKAYLTDVKKKSNRKKYIEKMRNFKDHKWEHQAGTGSFLDIVNNNNEVAIDLFLYAISFCKVTTKRDMLPATLLLFNKYFRRADWVKYLSHMSSFFAKDDENLFCHQANEGAFEDGVPITYQKFGMWWKNIKDSKFWKECFRMFGVVSSAIVHKFDMKKMQESKQWFETTKVFDFCTKVDFVGTICTSIEFVVQRLTQVCTTGKWQTLFHSEDNYEAWMNTAMEVQRESMDVDTPIFNRKNWLKKLRETITNGEDMIVTLRKYGGKHKECIRFVEAHLVKLKGLEKKFIGVTACAELRETPFSLFVCGTSNIAKSTLVEINRCFFGKLQDLDLSTPAYPRVAVNKYWDGYESYMWAILIDDAGCFKASKVMGIDDSIKEIIQIINNQAFLPVRAALEDKGRTPVFADLVQITSNVMDLNAPQYFNSTAAIFRRCKYRVAVEVLPEFRNDQGFLDSSKCTHADDAFPDWWNIRVERAYVTKDPTVDTNNPENMCKETCSFQPFLFQGKPLVNIRMPEYLTWLRTAILEHKVDQALMLSSQKRLQSVSLCDTCQLPAGNHTCPSLVKQAGLGDFKNHMLCNFTSICEIPQTVVISQSEVESFIQRVKRPFWGEVRFWMEDLWTTIWVSTIITCAFWKHYLYTVPSDFCVKLRDKFGHGDENIFVVALAALTLLMLQNATKTKSEAVWSLWLSDRTKSVWKAYDYTTTGLAVGAGLCFSMTPVGFLMMAASTKTVMQPIESTRKVLKCVGADDYLDHTIHYFNFAALAWAGSVLDDMPTMMRSAGKAVYKALGGSKTLMILVAALGTLSVVLYGIYRMFFQSEEHQGQAASFMRLAPSNEKENVWKKEDYIVDNFDIPLHASSLKNQSFDKVLEFYDSNIVHVAVKPRGADVDAQLGNGLFISGNMMLIPTHIIRVAKIVDVNFEFEHSSGITKNFITIIDEVDVKDFNSELSLVCVRAAPPKKDLVLSLPPPSLKQFRGDGILVRKIRDGSYKQLKLKDLTYQDDIFEKQLPGWTYRSSTLTVKGDCGGMIFALTPSGPVFVGMHNWINGNLMAAVDVTSLESKVLACVNPHSPRLTGGKVGKLGKLHTKSPLRFIEDDGTMTVYGSFDGFRCKAKSRVCRTLLAPLLEADGFVQTHGQPNMNGWRPVREHLKSFAKQNCSIESFLIKGVIKALHEHFLDGIPEDARDCCHMYDIETAVNGTPGVRFVDRINVKSSAGFPYRESKKKHLTPLIEGDWSSTLILNDDIAEDVEAIFDRYSKGYRAHPVFTSVFKDEARTWAKILAMNTRVFFGGPMGFIIVQRQLFLWFARLVQNNSELFMQAPGINAMSEEWTQMHKYLHVHPNFIAGDFKNFDTTMDTNVLLGAYDLIIMLARSLGANSEHLKYMEVCKNDLVFVMIDYFGDLLQAHGVNPSGHALTVLINGLVNNILMMIVFVLCHNPDVKSVEEVYRTAKQFFNAVRLVTYGDDNVMSVSNAYPKFNHTAISNNLAKYGITYTMAEKGRVSQPYITFDEVSFLKRIWRFEDEIGMYACPLEMTSIVKAMFMCIPSGFLSTEQQVVESIITQNNELFFHGKEIFSIWHTRLLRYISELNLESYMVIPLMTWDELVSRYSILDKKLEHQGCTSSFEDDIALCYRCYKYNCPMRGCTDDGLIIKCSFCDRCRFDDPNMDCSTCSLNQFCEDCLSSCVLQLVDANLSSVEDTLFRRVCTSCPSVEFYMIPNGLRPLLVGLGVTTLSQIEVFPNSYWSTDGASHHLRQSGSGKFRARVGDPQSTFLSKSAGAKVNDSRTSNGFHDVPLNNQQSTENTLQTSIQVDKQMMDTSSANTLDTSTTVSQTVRFNDATEGEIITFAKRDDSTFSADDQTAVDLGRFLERPTLIKTQVWTESGIGITTFYPWQLFFNDTIIKKKLDNFAYFRGNLKVKIMVNSSPFYYGAVYANYRPLPSFSAVYSSTTGDMIRASQQPGIWIYPQTSSGGEITLPFFYHRNYLDITTSVDTAAMGQMELRQYTNLQSANGATSNGVTIQIYAWCEDYTLTGATTKDSMQSGEGSFDEYGVGPVSGPAAALSDWMSYLEHIPIIGKYATATKIGAGSVSQIAKLFGWSNVPVIEDVKPMKNLPFHDLASAHLAEPVSKFTLDPKAELSVSPAMVGLDDTDEMTIANLVQKESYLTSVDWNTTDASGLQYFGARVSPRMFDRGSPTSGGTYIINQTPMCWASVPFGNWRGDIIFRFKIICSRFHQGRLRISWDPLVALGSTTDYSNRILTKVIDLADSDEVEFRVPYMQAVQWSSLVGIGNIDSTNKWNTGVSSPTPIVNADNGCITVRCLTNLSAPVDTAPANILVFVRGAENLQYANPIDINRRFSYIATQSGSGTFADTSMAGDSKPSSVHKDIYLLNYGEPIPSIRLLLRRSQFLDTQHPGTVGINDQKGEMRLYQTRFPPCPGYDPNGWATAKGVETPATTYPFNYSMMTSLAWFAPAFIANRGSIRYHYNANIENNLVGQEAIASYGMTRTFGQTLSGPGSLCVYRTLIPNGSATNSNCAGNTWVNTYSQGAGGIVLMNGHTQTGLSCELPQMNNYRFCSNNPYHWSLGITATGTNLDTYMVSVKFAPIAVYVTGAYNSTSIDRYVSIGTDFNLHYFLSVPSVYYNSSSGTTVVA
jgi:hypothetical protein